jgi:hypothetical protein
VAPKASHLREALCWAYQALGSDSVTGGDEVFRDLVLARIVGPTSKADSLQVLAEIGVTAIGYRTVPNRKCAKHYRSMRRPCGVGSGLSGALRRKHPLFRNRQTLTAADPLPDDLREALAKINADNAH